MLNSDSGLVRFAKIPSVLSIIFRDEIWNLRYHTTSQGAHSEVRTIKFREIKLYVLAVLGHIHVDVTGTEDRTQYDILKVPTRTAITSHIPTKSIHNGTNIGVKPSHWSRRTSI